MSVEAIGACGVFSSSNSHWDLLLSRKVVAVVHVYVFGELVECLIILKLQ